MNISFLSPSSAPKILWIVGTQEGVVLLGGQNLPNTELTQGF